jgi:hypothetical protein
LKKRVILLDSGRIVKDFEEGTYNHDDLDHPIDMSGMNVSFDLLANAQVGFKLYF